MPAASHVCPKCSYEHPCFFMEGDIVSLKEDLVNEPAPWTGIVLDVRRDPGGRVYNVLWGPPPARSPTGAVVAAKHSGAHRGDELQRFLVDLIAPSEMRRDRGGGEREAVPHRFSAPRP